MAHEICYCCGDDVSESPVVENADGTWVCLECDAADCTLSACCVFEEMAA